MKVKVLIVCFSSPGQTDSCVTGARDSCYRMWPRGNLADDRSPRLMYWWSGSHGTSGSWRPVGTNTDLKLWRGTNLMVTLLRTDYRFAPSQLVGATIESALLLTQNNVKLATYWTLDNERSIIYCLKPGIRNLDPLTPWMFDFRQWISEHEMSHNQLISQSCDTKIDGHMKTLQCLYRASAHEDFVKGY